MPAIRQISVDKNALTFTDKYGKQNVFDISDVPVKLFLDPQCITKLEEHINTVWLPPLLNNDLQVVVHIFSVSPLFLTVYTANIDEKIPQDWWIDSSDPNIKP